MTATHLLPPLNLKRWIDEHRALLKPPVGNKCVWEDRDFIVMVVGGPNHRKDFHINPTEELFYQVEGDMIVRIIDHTGTQRDIPIREGELFLLPPNVPHSPQRPASTVGLVVERRRPDGEDDGLRFYCDKCGATVHEERFELVDIAAQLKRMMEQFWSDATLRTCMQCGTVVQPPTGPALPPPPGMKADLPVGEASRATGKKASGKSGAKSASKNTIASAKSAKSTKRPAVAGRTPAAKAGTSRGVRSR